MKIKNFLVFKIEDKKKVRSHNFSVEVVKVKSDEKLYCIYFDKPLNEKDIKWIYDNLNDYQLFGENTEALFKLKEANFFKARW